MINTKSEEEFINNFNKSNSDFALFFDDEKISLRSTKNRNWLPFYIDFSSQEITRRLKQLNFNQELIKAIGIKNNYTPKILDTTAGLGRDSFMLASLGSKITLLERNEVIFTLLNNAIERAKKHQNLKKIINNMNLINIDSIDFLKNNKEDYDIIYIDPMFPKSKKTRLVKKDMQIFREIAGDDLDSENLLKLSISKKVKRVVVKRMLKSEYIGNIKPNFEIKGTTTRFDIYSI